MTASRTRRERQVGRDDDDDDGTGRQTGNDLIENRNEETGVSWRYEDWIMGKYWRKVFSVTTGSYMIEAIFFRIIHCFAELGHVFLDTGKALRACIGTCEGDLDSTTYIKGVG